MEVTVTGVGLWKSGDIKKESVPPAQDFRSPAHTRRPSACVSCHATSIALCPEQS